MCSDGPNHTIIKIKPPLTFTIENAKGVLFYLQKIVIKEVFKKGWHHKQGTTCTLKKHFLTATLAPKQTAHLDGS